MRSASKISQSNFDLNFFKNEPIILMILMVLGKIIWKLGEWTSKITEPDPVPSKGMDDKAVVGCLLLVYLLQ